MAMFLTFANLNVGEDVHVDEVWARHQIDGGEKHVASEQLLQGVSHELMIMNDPANVVQ